MALGSGLGAVLGIGAGIGMVRVLSEDLDWVDHEAALFISYNVTQGLFSALGSRLVAWIRG